MALEVLHVALLRITPVSALYLLYCTRTAQYSTVQYCVGTVSPICSEQISGAHKN